MTEDLRGMVLLLKLQNQGNDVIVTAELFHAIVAISSTFSVNVSFVNNYLKIAFIFSIYLVILCTLVSAYRLRDFVQYCLKS